MGDADGDQGPELGSKPPTTEKLPRAHKRCINKDCREVMSLATKYCKKCNTVQFEHKPSKNWSRSGVDQAGEGKRARKRKSADRSGSEDEPVEDSESDEEKAEAEQPEAQADLAAATVGGARFGSNSGLTNIPQATSYAIQQDLETVGADPFDCVSGPDKPMLELQAGSRAYYQASIIRESRTEIRVLFPETKKMAERREWVDKRSSRIWRGRMESRYWRYIKGSDGGWEPKLMGESVAGGSFRRKGSTRSRGSVGITRSRGTKHSTEEGTESEQRKRAAAALDTAASPRPEGLEKQQDGRRRHDGEASSSSGSDAGEASDTERQASGAGVASSEWQQANSGDPLEAWFKQHYALLKAADLLGTRFLPASAETGRPWANGVRRRRVRQHRRGKPTAAAAAQRSREQRRQERQAARQQSSEAESLEDEGNAVASPCSGGVKRPAKGERELKCLQMWAWERRGRDRGSSGEDEDEDASADNDTRGKDSAEKGSQSGGGQQQAEQRPNVEEDQAAVAKHAADAVPQAAAQRPAASEPAASSLQGAGRAGEGRATPGSGDARQPRPKQQTAAVQQPQPKPRPLPKPLAMLEECDVFGKLAPIRRQHSGMQPPTSPRAVAVAATAAGGIGKPGPAAAGSQLHLPKQPSDVSVKVPPAASSANKQAPALAAPASEQQQQAANSGVVSPAGPEPISAAAEAPPAVVQPPKPVLSPLKRKMLERSGAGEAAATRKLPAGEQQQQLVAGKPSAKLQHVEAEGSAAKPGAAAAGAAGGAGNTLSPHKRLLQVGAVPPA